MPTRQSDSSIVFRWKKPVKFARALHRDSVPLNTKQTHCAYCLPNNHKDNKKNVHDLNDIQAQNRMCITNVTNKHKINKARITHVTKKYKINKTPVTNVT